MPQYELTAPAKEDLKEIARYTLTKWGKKQSLIYADLLENCFCSIANGATYSRSISNSYPQVFTTKCEHHYIFYVQPQKASHHALLQCYMSVWI